MTDTRLSPDEQAEIANIVKQVVGITPGFSEQIVVPEDAPGLRQWGHTGGTISAAGYYSAARDAVQIALDTGNRRTAYHEAFHRLQARFLNAQERRLLAGETQRLRQMWRPTRAGPTPPAR